MAQEFQPFPTRAAQEVLAATAKGKEGALRALLGYFLLWAKMAALVAESPYIFSNGSRAMITNSDGTPGESAVTDTEIGYLDGVTSAIQTQINAKAPTASPTFTGTVTAPTMEISTRSVKLPVLTSAPSSPANGEIVYADGSGWDPIGGGTPGFVGYEAGAWVKL